MANRITRKSVNAQFARRISVTYCGIQHILSQLPKYGYCTRAEGWACDVYVADINTAIVTGYAPFGNYEAPYDVCQKYDKMAEEVLCKETDYYVVRDKCSEILGEFVKEVCGK